MEYGEHGQHELTDVRVRITLSALVPAAAIPGGGLEKMAEAWAAGLAGKLSDDVQTTCDAAGGMPKPSAAEWTVELQPKARRA